MSLITFKPHELGQSTYRLDRGNFSLWKIDNFYRHGPTKFDVSHKLMSIFFESIDTLPEKRYGKRQD